MADIIQTHAAPDLLTFGKTDEGVPIARVGSVAVPYTPLDIAPGQVMISVENLRKLQKQGYVLGWQAKCIHVRGLIDKIPAEIGS